MSRVAKTLDAAVAAFHRRPLQNRYQALMLDGVVLARKTGAGALRRPVLVALGLRHDGKKEIIDFRLAASESTAEWEQFLADLYRRGLSGEKLDMICVDGGSGLLAALPNVFPADTDQLTLPGVRFKCAFGAGRSDLRPYAGPCPRHSRL